MSQQSFDEVSIKSRLADILQKELESRNLSLMSLAEKIWHANECKEGYKIDRRKLAAIINSKYERNSQSNDVKISLTELDALNTYLEQSGQGIFVKPTVIKSLIQKGEVSFLLGAKPDHNEGRKVTNVSPWDVHSVASILRAIDRVATGVHYDIEIALRRPAGAITSQVNPESLFAQEPWFRLFHDRDAPSLLIVGSPRASHASEIAMSLMFGIPPFAPMPASSRSKFPCLFVLSPDEFGKWPSSFAVSGAELSADDLKNFDSRERKTWAIQVEGKFITVKDSIATNSNMGAGRDSCREYGLLAVQRRRKQTWMLISGLTGPATSAAARLVDSLAALPSGDLGQNSPVVWAIVETDVEKRDDRKEGDTREVVDQRILIGPNVWLPQAP